LDWCVSEKEAVVLSRRTIIGITGIFLTGVFIASGFAESQAGPVPLCTLVIEINALRGGSPTVPVNGTKKITAKARILKGTAVKGTTIDTTLRIDAVDGLEVINSHSSSPHRLQIGKGGKGDTFPMDIPQCNSGYIEFVATFFGTDDNGGSCEGTGSMRKTCN
jgi:hypothetical protein